MMSWRGELKPPKIPSPEIQAYHAGIQVDQRPVAVEGVLSIQQDVTPRCWRDLREQRTRFGVATRLVSGEQPGGTQTIGSAALAVLLEESGSLVVVDRTHCAVKPKIHLEPTDPV
ncbi:MAG: hypothetical protein NVS2B7_35230 [Herpetosiphon sp.]